MLVENGSMHRYYVGLGVIGPWPFIDISDREFQAVTTAKRNLLRLLGVEEKFRMLIENFVEYERELLNLALQHKISHDINWSAMQDAKALINRRLANCLTVARLYLDQAQRDANEAFSDSHIPVRIMEAARTQYDKLLGYRVMEAARNYLQHESLPITAVAYATEWEDRNGEEFLHHRITPLIRPDRLRDSGFKKSVVEELERIDKKNHDATPLLREYIEGLSVVHQEFRTATGEYIPAWKSTLLAIIERYSRASGEQVSHVIAYAEEGGDTVERITIFMDGVARLEEYRTKRLPTNVSRWFVSNAQK